MGYAAKIVLHCRTGYRPELDKLIEQFISDGVRFIGVVGPDASRIEDIIDEICCGDGTRDPHFILTASHEGETLKEALDLVDQLTGEYIGPAEIVEF